MNDKICLLNRKPYRDKNGVLRVRTKCCGKKDSGCTLNKQPEGVVVNSGADANELLAKVDMYSNRKDESDV